MKKLTLGNDRMLAGVCSGFADYFGIDPTIIRILTIIGCLCTGIVGIALYFIIGILMDR